MNSSDLKQGISFNDLLLLLNGESVVLDSLDTAQSLLIDSLVARGILVIINDERECMENWNLWFGLVEVKLNVDKFLNS